MDWQQGLFESRPELMSLPKLLTWTGGALSRYHQRAVAEHGLSPTALGVLGVLGHRDGISHRELAGHLGLTPAALTPVVDGLEAAGEVLRCRDTGDRRVVRLSVTESGRERLRLASEGVVARLRERLPRPDPGQEEVVRGYLLAVLAAVADEETEGRPSPSSVTEP